MFRRGNWCLVGWAYFVVLIFLNNIIPSWAGQENGIIENLQLLILALGMYYSWKQTKWSNTDESSIKFLWYGMMIYFLILFARELSWGEELLPFVNSTYYRFIDMGISRRMIHAVLAVFIFVGIFCLYEGHVFAYIRTVKLPVIGLILLGCFIGMAWVAEKYKRFTLFSGALGEELAEVGAYVMMVYLLYDSVREYRRKAQ